MTMDKTTGAAPEPARAGERTVVDARTAGDVGAKASPGAAAGAPVFEPAGVCGASPFGLTRRGFCALAGAAGLALAAGLGLAGCADENAPDPDAADSASEADEAAGREVEKAAAGGTELRERKGIYADDDEGSVVCMYLTVRRGNSGDGTDHTWEEVNEHSKYWYAEQGIKQYACEAILQIGDETGPLPEELGYTAVVPNATVAIRGQSSTYYTQKNYKVKLKKDRGSWRDQVTINLNKHQQDGMRFRNKLAFDLLKEVPQTTACRTQFVHLYVRDQTQGAAVAFEDYGLYTQVEQLNKKYLGNHGLDRYGQLYKIEFFEFYRYPDAIKLTTDPTYDEAAFSEVLESKGNSDHTKLIAMLEDLNDYSVPMEETLDKWFDVENLVYWMAFHMLIGNYDVQSRNGFLYSPQNVERFYLLSWDNDVCFTRTEWELRGKQDGLGWERGVSNYWGSVLFNRALRLPSFREALDAAVRDLVATCVNAETVEALVGRYREVVEPFLFSEPDLLNSPLTRQGYDEVARAIPGEVEMNLGFYEDSLKTPMPFYIGTPTLEAGTLEMGWDASYDFGAQAITYQATLARDSLFKDVVVQEDDLQVPVMHVDDPGEGQYFLKVQATNEDGCTQTAFDSYVLEDEGSKVYGTVCFYIMGDGSVVLDEGAGSLTDPVATDDADDDDEDAEGGERA